MSSSKFDKNSVVSELVTLAIGIMIGFCLSGIVNIVRGSSQTECKELDGIQVCRDAVYYDWKVKEVDK